jgi:hypothetical protein
MASPVASSSSIDLVDSNVSFQVAYRGQSHSITVPLSSNIRRLQDEISDLTHVDATHQKLLGSGSLRSIFGKAKDNEDKTLVELGVTCDEKKPHKLMLVGPTNDELDAVQRGDLEAEKRNRPRVYHPSMLKGGKPRNTTKSSTSNPFHSLKVHPISPPSTPEYDLVLSRLRKLSTDPAVVHVCRLHNFQVGELTELLPHEHPNLLGLNENMGQRISVRVRTTAHYDGLITYKETRTVLLHELAHNKVNDHPPEFKILNSELNAQVEAYENKVSQGTNYLSDMDFYVPEEANGGANALQETTHILGGSVGESSLEQGSVQDKRQRILLATMKRLEKQENEIEKGCGSTT